MLEVQITKEYLGLATQPRLSRPDVAGGAARRHLCERPGLDGRESDRRLAGRNRPKPPWPASPMSARDRNWCGSEFNQANWYAFGRLAWDPGLSARAIADEWVRMTFTNDRLSSGPSVDMMMGSREAVVDYMTPLGLHHQMATGHHYGPGPWVEQCGPAGLESGLLSSRRHGRHRLRPHRHRQQCRRAICAARCATIRGPRRRCRTNIFSGFITCSGITG